jgi:hypothetical protein
MKYTGSAAVRQPVPDLPEHDRPITPGPEGRYLSAASFLAAVLEKVD